MALRVRSWRSWLGAPVAVTLLGAGLVVVLATAPAGATTVLDETTFRAAWTNPAETQIDLAANITLTCPGGASIRPNTATGAITVNGHGHTITQTCASNSVLIQDGTGALTFQNVTITGGHAFDSGGGIASDSNVSLMNSTVSGNTAPGGVGGGIFASGNVSLTNSTVSGNTALAAGGGIDGGSVSLVYATVVGNSAPAGANIDAPVGGGPTLTSFGSVVALRLGGGANCVGVTTSNGYNWDDDGSCGFGAGPGDHSNGGNPLLGALANNGGPTQTRLPLAGSGLIDAIPNAACQLDGATGIATDQRSLPRPFPAGGACDIGAVEVQAPAPAPAPAPVVITPKFTG
jgi:hypothetical protein